MDEINNEFQYFHSYARLVADEKALPILCECGQQYVTMLSEGRLVLWCPVDDTQLVPGLALKLRVKETVDRNINI